MSSSPVVSGAYFASSILSSMFKEARNLKITNEQIHELTQPYRKESMDRLGRTLAHGIAREIGFVQYDIEHLRPSLLRIPIPDPGAQGIFRVARHFTPSFRRFRKVKIGHVGENFKKAFGARKEWSRSGIEAARYETASPNPFYKEIFMALGQGQGHMMLAEIWHLLERQPRGEGHGILSVTGRNYFIVSDFSHNKSYWVYLSYDSKDGFWSIDAQGIDFPTTMGLGEYVFNAHRVSLPDWVV